MKGITVHSTRLITFATTGLLLLSGLVAQAGAGQKDPAELLPEDTLLYVAITDVNAAKEAFKKTSLWGLYKDPAMRAFMEPAEKAVRKLLDEKLQELWKSIEVESPPESPPWPTGQVVVAVQMVMTTNRIAVYDWQNTENGSPKIKEWRDVTSPEPQVVILAEMGENMPALKEIIAQAVEKGIDEGMQRKSETVRGLEMHVMTPKPAESPDGADGVMPMPSREPNPVCYALIENTALLSSSPELLKGVLARMAGADSPSLASNEDRKNILRQLGAPGDLTFYMNVKTLIGFIKSMAPASQADQTERIIKALGFDNVLGLGVVAKIAPNDKQELSLKGLVAIQGAKRGIPELLSPKSASTAGNPLLTKGLASFVVANYELGTFYEKIRQMVIDAGGPDINNTVQGVMMMTAAMGGPEGTPPVNLGKDVLGQLAAPLVIRNRVTKPYTDPNASRTMITLGVQDPAVLAAALGRLHGVFIARGNKEMRRELLNTEIFLLPGGPQLLGMMFVGMPMGAAQSEPWAFAVAGSNLVFGSVSGVEQEIRNLRRTDAESIQADPMYQYAAASLPAQAGVWFYANQQISNEVIWQRVKQAARAEAEKPETDGGEVTEFSQTSITLNPANPMVSLAGKLRNVCDFNTLPDFQAVKKYFGPSVGYVKSTDEGIYFEILLLKAPPAKAE